jgi:hypothetical protein
MRYFNQAEVVFARVLLKAELPVPKPAAAHTSLRNYNGQLLDELAVQFYGEQMESECYRIFDENIAALTEANFDLAKLTSLRIPL